MRKQEYRDKQLRLLTRGDAVELKKFKKAVKVRLRVRSAGQQINASNVFIDNLITTEELATILRVTSQTIRNWVARGKIPYIQVGRRNLFQMGSIQKWLNQKEEPLWE